MAQMIPVKERMKRDQVPMPEQDPQERIHNFRDLHPPVCPKDCGGGF